LSEIHTTFSTPKGNYSPEIKRAPYLFPADFADRCRKKLEGFIFCSQMAQICTDEKLNFFRAGVGVFSLSHSAYKIDQ
jgi:hypothetical protein